MKKYWFQSKTVIGSILTFVIMALGLFGFQVTNQQVFLQQGTDILLGVAGVVTTALTLYGRAKATGSLVVKKQ